MTGALIWKARRLLRRVGVRVAAYGVVGGLTALAGVVVGSVMPDFAPLGVRVSADAAQSLLSILTSSMLAVTTFSLSIMAAAYASASSTATPRAFRLLREDTTAQQVLASFMGAFVFGLVGLIALKLGVYGASGRIVLFAMTVGMFGIIVTNLIRWTSHLTDFGRMTDTLRRLEDAATCAVMDRLKNPWLGGRPLRVPPDVTGVPVWAGLAGSVQHIDMAKLSRVAGRCDVQVYVRALPGTVADAATPLAYVTGPQAETAVPDIAAAFVVEDHRSFEQDPRFGLCALAEVASRALSPAVNDPGTAIDVLARIVRILSKWKPTGEPDIKYPRIWVPSLETGDLLHDAFAPIARDGAALIEVQVRVQKSLQAVLAVAPEVFGDAVRVQSARARDFAIQALVLPEDRVRVAGLAEQIARD